MGERKVLNKYFPPDFDPSLIPRQKRQKNKQIEVRMMLPMSIQCDTCGEYMYRGKKFNSRKEDVVEEDYHEITFKTDPKNGDYTTEKGCSRNFEIWREKEEHDKQAKQKKDDEEQGDSMKTLENRTLDSKREMDILDALDEMKAINQRHERVDTAALLNAQAKRHASVEVDSTKEDEEKDRELAKQAFAQAKAKKEAAPSVFALPEASATKSKPSANLSIAFKKKASDPKPKSKKKKSIKKAAPAVTSLVATYSDSSSD